MLAAYAAGVAMNGFLPANIGTFVMLLMFVAMIPRATFSGVLGGMVVQKIFFTVIGTLVYLYLFISVGGSLELQLNLLHDHPVLVPLVVAGGIFLIVVLARVFWPRIKKLWENAKQGGAILGHPRAYVLKVLLPSIGAWLSKLAVTGIFLAGYGIPVTFHSIMSVIGGNSLANTVSATPGGVGVNQAVNVIALDDYADAATATAYSLGQQLAITAFNVVFAVVVVVWAFGWTGGKLLVSQSYTGAKDKVAEQKEQRAEKKAARSARNGASCAANDRVRPVGRLAARPSSLSPLAAADRVGVHRARGRVRRAHPSRCPRGRPGGRTPGRRRHRRDERGLPADAGRPAPAVHARDRLPPDPGAERVRAEVDVGRPRGHLHRRQLLVGAARRDRDRRRRASCWT